MSLLHLGLYKTMLAANTSVNFTDGIPQPIVNILAGIGMIAAAIIAIAGVISIFKYISNSGSNNQNRTSTNQNPPANTVKPVSTAVDEVAGKNLINDSELVAVITAAIMASMGDEAPADGLIVRSIRKVNNKRWQNA
ncbi:OadG family protein [Anaerocolumna sp. MB42-C2]|uniref:OadG family protein n=1 Tax=Anaerocolumna sp. MB42-C2 TaxID=3070997 RepID=UPI0027DF07FD|nr:OadG family protein [Anaerocolumna sp. MB42-C2]WMJ88302.1 OadG family protein [Anaerocolumna sp. MB42-C2]